MEPTGIVVSELNTFSQTVSAGQTITGTGEDIRFFAEATINLYGTPAVASGTLYFEYSPDNVNWDVSVPYVLSGPQSFVPLPLRTVLPYFRVKYVNGATPLSAFRLTTVYHWSNSKQVTRVLNQLIDENEPVENVRAFIGGKSPDGPYTNLPSGGKVSNASTNAPLGINGVYNSSIVSTLGFVASSIAVKSDQNSIASGLVISFYADSAGTRLLKTSVFTYGSAPNGTAFQVPAIAGPYMKVTYTNGAVAQSAFELLTTLSVSAPPSDVLSVSETINGNTAAQIVKASIVGQREDGVYANSKLSNSNSQMVAIADRPSEVRNRTRVENRIFRTSLTGADTVIYTVTSGKTLYITAFVSSFINNANAIGEWRIRDNETDRIGFVSGEKAVGASAPNTASSPTLPEPIAFTHSVRAYEISGDMQVAFWFIGYEE